MSSEFQATLRRLKPEKRRSPLTPRNESSLNFIGTAGKKPRKLLYDTTVYIDVLQNRFPREGEFVLRTAEAWHSPVTEAELSATIGLLDPVRKHVKPGTSLADELIAERREAARNE